MDVRTAINLKPYTTMQLGGDARFMAVATTPEEVRSLYATAEQQHLPVFVLGGGSNVLVRDEGFDGIVLLNRLQGFEVVGQTEATTTIRIAAGEVWDEVVARTVAMGLSGIEALSAIPGTAGAAPVQNIGAYGQEVADTLVSVEAYDSLTDQFVTLENEACQFAYRHSIFRGEQAGRYCITAITLELYRALPKPPFYSALERYFEERHITQFTPQVVRDAVMAIRADKLPDPAIKPNAGSFFKNAIIDRWQAEELLQKYPAMPHYDMPNDRVKVPTGWLIEQAGMKGQLLYGMRVHDKNALVLINEAAESYANLAAARQEIIQAVYDMFHIQIEQEPLEMTRI
ncbi:MAG: UDP-N-acetylmuramate dehydrogenase [Candidatus Saccharibacteria bacterium]|nr:UDP-N-acetylmuramate dehydrogenase [Candidatus Saccharibacteria bacterium]